MVSPTRRPTENVLESYLLGKSTDQLPPESLFINNKKKKNPDDEISQSIKVQPGRFASFIVKLVKNTCANHLELFIIPGSPLPPELRSVFENAGNVAQVYKSHRRNKKI